MWRRCGWPNFDYARNRMPWNLCPTRHTGQCGPRCGSHLGHVFEGEGYATPTDEWYCINSISLTLRSSEG
nr:peptide-methionine (R)-S-oxide reductase [Streptomyces sp. YIM 130001]